MRRQRIIFGPPRTTHMNHINRELFLFALGSIADIAALYSPHNLVLDTSVRRTKNIAKHFSAPSHLNAFIFIEEALVLFFALFHNVDVHFEVRRNLGKIIAMHNIWHSNHIQLPIAVVHTHFFPQLGHQMTAMKPCCFAQRMSFRGPHHPMRNIANDPIVRIDHHHNIVLLGTIRSTLKPFDHHIGLIVRRVATRIKIARRCKCRNIARQIIRFGAGE
mmetsp:Transcript_9245/g.14188  ORF Transcript_9245/g.14188 Transcript_9245/m.14188 type:complete len:218 (-) Transcript_9245:869-1522(-)